MTQPRRALVLVDIQNEYFDGPLEIQYPPRNETLAAIIDALTIAGENNVPVAAIRHELPEGAPVFAAGSTGAQLHPEVADLVQSDWQQTSRSSPASSPTPTWRNGSVLRRWTPSLWLVS